MDHEGHPGTDMEPLDDAAWKAFHDYHAERKRKGLPAVTRFPFKVKGVLEPPPEPPKLVEIPSNWRELGPFGIHGIARKLGAPKSISEAEATRLIEIELTQRAIGAQEQEPEADGG